ncbi:hypothetical protein B0T17DRAFT_623301 [Bombardia bombarda]|uniref:Uncharacterized protein n=1 Tax=Bombardia bombarda TaxID=252184 RepID=A0AA39XJ85_9PEZI|nr:hypothetical protein B0T17DRAFT_623301 [Bombardia bombarda]
MENASRSSSDSSMSLSSLLGEENSSSSTRLVGKSRGLVMQRSHVGGILSFIRKHMVLTIVFAMSILQWAFVISSWRTSPGGGVPLSEIHGLVPEFGTKAVRFNSTREDGARAMYESDPAWTNVMSKGSGFVVVDGWHKYADTLPPAIHLNNREIFSVAMFHQLHCLHYMLKEFNKLLDPNKTHHDGQHEQQTGPGHEHSDESHEEAMKHVGHCFDYLRNSLMCCGDVAFEGQGSDVEGAGTLGEASYHVCKDFDKIKAWTEAARFNSYRGFND